MHLMLQLSVLQSDDLYIELNCDFDVTDSLSPMSIPRGFLECECWIQYCTRFDFEEFELLGNVSLLE